MKLFMENIITKNLNINFLNLHNNIMNKKHSSYTKFGGTNKWKEIKKFIVQWKHVNIMKKMKICASYKQYK